MYTPSSSYQTPDEPEEGPKRIVRISKACENCRVRRIRCEPPFPCKACRTANRDDCQVRSKPRPGRSSSHIDTTRLILGTTIKSRLDAITNVERALEAWFSGLTGEPSSLALEETPTHPVLDLSVPYDTFPHISLECAPGLESFIKHCLPFCAYVTAPNIRYIFERCLQPVPDVSPDQMALLCICLAAGYVRLQYFGESRHAMEVPEHQRMDVGWFRRAVDILEKWGEATFTSLHTLGIMWFYTTLVAPSRLSRFVITWMIAQARELNINRDITHTMRSPSDRAEQMVSLVTYAHFTCFSLGGQAPIILPDEFNISMPDASLPENLLSLRTGTTSELMSMNNSVLRDMADASIRDLSIEWLLNLESKWAQWDTQRQEDVRMYGPTPADRFVRNSFHWGQIVVRLAILEDTRFQISSSAMLLAAASEIISSYSESYAANTYNLIWPQLRQVVTSAQIIVWSVLKGATSPIAAAPLVNASLGLIALFLPRWGAQARRPLKDLENMAAALSRSATFDLTSGIPLQPTYPPIQHDAPPSVWNIDDFYTNAGLALPTRELDNLIGS